MPRTKEEEWARKALSRARLRRQAEEAEAAADLARTHGLPKVTEVIAAMAWPCPHEDCERHTRPYDDGHRLDHHVRLHHGGDVRRAEERLVLSNSEVLDGLANGTVRAWRVG